MNWLKWLLLENRQFEDHAAVENRIQFLLARMVGEDWGEV